MLLRLVLVGGIRAGEGTAQWEEWTHVQSMEPGRAERVGS